MEQKKSTSTKKAATLTERHFYKVAADSATGKAINRYWHACIKCEQAAEDYCKKFGATYYYSDPKYFAGGVACVAFAEGEAVDERLWQKFMTIGGEQYYVPACRAERGSVEVPNRDYQLRDTWDTMYLRDRIQEVTVKADDGSTVKRLMMPKISFRPLGEQTDPQGRTIQASRKQRRAIIAEQKRLKLPVMTVQQLYRIFGAVLPEGRLSQETPTFFLRSTTFYFGCAYPCEAKGLTEVTAQQYRMNQSMAERELRRQSES